MNYIKEAKKARLKVLDLIYTVQSSHIGSNFSCIDLLLVIFNKIDLSKDKFILSKGWAAASLYYFLWKKGKISKKELNSYCKEDSKFIGLSEPIIPEIAFAGGSMGFGFPAAVGFALSKKLKNEEGKIYVLMSDGELQCGTTWEAALIAAKHKLDNIIVIIDNNNFQAMGKTKNILDGYFPSRDWKLTIINGHDYGIIEDRIFGYFSKFTKPKVIIANTIKGRGVHFMENENIWHYKAPNKDEYLKAQKELNV